MIHKYYISYNKISLGPFSIDELNAKKLRPETLVRNSDSSTWVRADSILELSNAILENKIEQKLINNSADKPSKLTFTQKQDKDIEFKTYLMNKNSIRATNKHSSASSSNNNSFSNHGAASINNLQNNGFELATRKIRFFAFVFELLAVLIPSLILSGVNLIIGLQFGTTFIAVSFCFLIAYSIIFYSRWSGNIGHVFFGVKVVSLKNGQEFKSPYFGILRELLKYISTLLLLPSIWLLWDKNRQNLYDKLTNSIVVKSNSSSRGFFKGCFQFVFVVIIGLGLTIISSILLYTNGIPAISNFVVNRIPTSLDSKVGLKVSQQILASQYVDQEKSKLLQEFYDKLGYSTDTKVYVVNDSQFNAFSLPDRTIFVNSVVFDKVNSYSQLAALLGHEYAHIHYRHSMKLIGQDIAWQLVTVVLFNQESSTFVGHANTLLELKNSRYFENQADLGGLNLMAEKKINLNAMVELMEILNSVEGNGGQIPTFLRTHPETKDRIISIRKELSTRENIYCDHPDLIQIFQQLKGM